VFDVLVVVWHTGERYNVKIGELEDNECAMKRNIIHLLCLQPMSHSELVKHLPDDVCIIHLVVVVAIIVTSLSKSSSSSIARTRVMHSACHKSILSTLHDW